jgi:glutathione S-transferase
MPDFELFIGNKNYSSWSFRPWIALRQKGIPFRETLVPFDFAGGNRHFEAFSPSGKVPVLKDGGLTVWDSLAILEYAAECFPEADLWPQPADSRALARAVSAEMHSGFAALRSACPMNMRRDPRADCCRRGGDGGCQPGLLPSGPSASTGPAALSFSATSPSPMPCMRRS